MTKQSPDNTAAGSDVVTLMPVQAVNDSLENETDALADKVMRMPEQNFIQRKCAHCEEEKAQRKPLASFIQRKGSATGTVAGDNICSQVNASKGNGNSIDASTRSFMENRFDTDFSDVKIHTGNEAIQMNRELSAKAFTVGNDIYFNEGQYQPCSYSGKHLLAHELTHTVQQSASTAIRRQANTGAAAPAAVDNGGLSDVMLEQIARRLHTAMQGWGTDEEAIYSAFSGRTQPQVDAIERTYNNLYNRSLIADLQDELNEDEMNQLAIFSPTALEGRPGGFAELIAYQLRNAMEGWGTDESSIMNALTGRTEAERIAIKQAYNNLTHRDLTNDLKDELSGKDLTIAMRLLEQGVLTAEDEIMIAVAGLGTDEESLMSVLRTVQGDRAKIRALINAYQAKGYGEMLYEVRDDLSGSDLDLAMELLHGQTQSGTCNAGQRKAALEAISVAASMAQKAIDILSADIAGGQLSDNTESALKNNFNRGNAIGAVNVALAAQVIPTLTQARNDMLMTSVVNCGDIGLCVGKQNCSVQYSPAWTSVGVTPSTVQLCSSFFACDPEKTTSMLHEFLHHTGLRDHAYHFQPGFAALTPQGNMSATDSLTNTDSFAHFAKDLW